MSYTRTIPTEENTGLGPVVKKPVPDAPEWVPTDNPLIERNTRDGTMRTKDFQREVDELAGLPLDIAYAMRKMQGKPC
jgi:hypothetical protein